MESHEACRFLLEELRRRSNPADFEGMSRFGISNAGTLGVSMREVRALGREALSGRRQDGGYRHELATCLWASGVHEARILATIVE